MSILAGGICLRNEKPSQWPQMPQRKFQWLHVQRTPSISSTKIFFVNSKTACLVVIFHYRGQMCHSEFLTLALNIFVPETFPINSVMLAFLLI